MRHGIAFRKLSRSSSHRGLLLRNLVSSLLEHERITTTVAKAKEASRVAEWVISWGKRGTEAQKRRAQAFLLNPTTTLPKLFNELSKRYASRPGGYTRVHHFGHRKGDHAPQAILELVDNPQDLRYHMTARIVGRELARLLKSQPHNKKLELQVTEWATTSTGTPLQSRPEVYDLLNDLTRHNIRKALQYVPVGSSPSSNGTEPAESTASAEASTSASTSSSSEHPTKLTLQHFDELAREAFLRTTAISKVQLWDIDMQKYEDLLLHAPSEARESTPVTVPGHGRKLWAGQEDLNLRYDGWDPATTTTPSKTSRSRAAQRQEEAEEEWEDEETKLNATELKEQRAKYLKKKLRHPEGRNGNHGQRSAIARSKGHIAPPRTLRERFLRADMPVTTRG
ncbi:hypothetical protein P389DRAFT_151481 [Cystobasidium minutum MCA 4210]|uniref:mitochondrial 54S ribosomal bL17m domain-containing protein n=1 Tax=Cystobasidium minutum MCA 4210 TaxID=1397322 RepID=UPI0034CF38A7|eukprot:jgi/Rhomi1/151481/estExt_Genewise1.C_3_t20283